MAEGKSWLASKIGNMLPSREELEHSRLIRPVAHLLLRPALWRFTRRSVPRGIAIGFFVGILVMVPGLQPVAAAFAAIPFRANVPLAVGVTLLTNPVTTPFLLMGSLWIGSDLFAFHADPSALMEMVSHHASVAEWWDWLLSSAAPALLSGLVVLAAVCGLLGYVIAVLVWRMTIMGKWRRRRRRQQDPIKLQL
jgi:uncharacterized protein (DUF2062 family)